MPSNGTRVQLGMSTDGDALNARDSKWRGTADGKQRANTKRTVFPDYQTADKHLLKTSANEDDRGDATREQLSSRKLEKN